MKNKNWLLGGGSWSKAIVTLGILLVLAGIGYLAEVAWSRLFSENADRLINQDSTLDVSFEHPDGWNIGLEGDSFIVFESRDFRFRCGDGGLYSRSDMERRWSGGDDIEPGPCFRAPIATGSSVSVVNGGDIGFGDYNLSSIPDGNTDGNLRGTVKNVKYIKVDGYNAVSWEDSYGDSPVSNLSVVIIKGHNSYSIHQSWAYGEPNPYPNVVADILKSFKFTD